MKKLIIIFILTAFCALSYGQGIVSVGAPKTTQHNLGAYWADSVIILPRAFANYNWLDSVGRIWYQGGKVYYHDGTSRIALGTGTGSVTSVGSGYGLLGGPITTTGTLFIDTSQIATRFWSDTAFRRKYNSYTKAQVDSDIVSRGYGIGSVTSVGSGYGLLGGPITTTGSLLVDTSNIVTYYQLHLSQIDTTSLSNRINKKEDTSGVAGNQYAIAYFSGRNSVSSSHFFDSINVNRAHMYDSMYFESYVYLKNTPAATLSDSILVKGATGGTVRVVGPPTGIYPVTVTWPGNVFSVDTSSSNRLVSASYLASFGYGTVNSVTGTTNRITSTGGANPVINISTSYIGQPSITTLGIVGTGAWQASVIQPLYGGTGQSVYNVGDIIYASGTAALSKLTIGSPTQVLGISGGIPAWVTAATGTVTSIIGGRGITGGTITTSGTLGLDTTQPYIWLARQSISISSIGAGSVVGLLLANPTAATSVLPSRSPAIEMAGFCFNTTTLTSDTVKFRFQVEPTNNIVDGGNWGLYSSTNGSAPTKQLNVSNLGVLTTTGNLSCPAIASTGVGSNTFAGPITASSTVTITSGSASLRTLNVNRTGSSTNASLLVLQQSSVIMDSVKALDGSIWSAASVTATKGIFGSTVDDGVNVGQFTGTVKVTSLPVYSSGGYSYVVGNSTTSQLQSLSSFVSSNVTVDSFTATGNTTRAVAANQGVIYITFFPAGNESIKVGTTSGGIDVVPLTAFLAGTYATVAVNKTFSNTASTTLFIQGAAGSVRYSIHY